MRLLQIEERKLDPRTKLIIVLCITSLAVFITDIYFLIGIFLMTLIVTAILKSNWITLIKKMKRLLWVFAAIIVMQSIFSPEGIPIIEVGKITLLTKGGILKGLQLALRMAIVILSASIMSTSNPREVVQGLVQWKIPYEIAFMVSIAIRFLPLLMEEIKDTVIAIQLRGIELEKIPIGKRVKIYSYVLMPVVAGAMIKSKRLAIAMESKGFGAYTSRTSFKILKMSSLDYIIMAVSGMISIVTLRVYFFIG